MSQAGMTILRCDLAREEREHEATRQRLAAERERVRELEAAIRTHRGQRGHDRCYLDDDVLYATLPEGPQSPNGLPPREEFLAGCERFERLRRHPLAPIDSTACDPFTLLANAEALLTDYRTVMGPPGGHAPTEWAIQEIAARIEAGKAADARVRDLTEALTTAVKTCGLCHGTGEWQPHCYKCDDSGEDHIDCPPSQPCTRCQPLKAALELPR
jgi:cytochrome c553